MSEKTHEIIPQAGTDPAPQMLMHPLVAEMLKNSPTPETLREILNLQREWEAGMAKRAYTRALVELRRDLPAWIKRDQVVDFAGGKGRVHYTHASLAATMEAVLPALTAHGFSLSWTPATGKDGVSVTASLTHRDGHSENATISAPPDSSGSKSAPQAIASTMTLLQRYSAMALLGIATSDMDEPRSGNGSDSTPVDQVDTARNMKAMSAIATAGKSRDDAEKFVGRPIQEWTVADLVKLRAWIAPEPPKQSTPKKPETDQILEPDNSRPVNAEELKTMRGWMKRFEIGAEMIGIVESATGRKPASAKDVTARQFAILADKFGRLERGEVDLNKKEMRFIEPPPEPSAAESGKTAEQLNAEAQQQDIPF